MKQKPKAIIFDCFGVLLTDALSELVGSIELEQPAVAREIRSLIHTANRGIISPEVSTQRVAELLGISVEAYRTRIREGEVRNQPLFDYIKTLRANYKTAMLSNITVQGIERRFPGNELVDYFDEIVISSAIGYAKPDAQAYEIAAERLDLAPEECLFTDDRPDYCEGARQVGMQTIEFHSFAQFRRELTEVIG